MALNTNASRGRIEDADFAKESARLTRAQILQQSAMAMIAQAGKAQQNVLQLLQQYFPLKNGHPWVALSPYVQIFYS